MKKWKVGSCRIHVLHRHCALHRVCVWVARCKTSCFLHVGNTHKKCGQCIAGGTSSQAWQREIINWLRNNIHIKLLNIINDMFWLLYVHFSPLFRVRNWDINWRIEVASFWVTMFQCDVTDQAMNKSLMAFESRKFNHIYIIYIYIMHLLAHAWQSNPYTVFNLSCSQQADGRPARRADDISSTKVP